jgi:hypothetical protein
MSIKNADKKCPQVIVVDQPNAGAAQQDPMKIANPVELWSAQPRPVALFGEAAAKPPPQMLNDLNAAPRPSVDLQDIAFSASELNVLSFPVLVPIVPNTIFPILHIFVRFFTNMCIFYKYVKKLIVPNLYQYFKVLFGLFYLQASFKII